MQFQQTATHSHTRTPRRQTRTWLVGAAGATLLAAVALGSWRGLAQRDSGTTVTESSVVAVTPATVEPAVASPLSAAPTVYVVASPAEATRVLEVIGEGNRLLDQFGKAPFTAQVVVATSADEAAALAQAHAEVNAQRATMGLASLTLIDLRSR